nr:hypothetical protein BaRGS_025802 [Batillaria attramentaria]
MMIMTKMTMLMTTDDDEDGNGSLVKQLTVATEAHGTIRNSRLRDVIATSQPGERAVSPDAGRGVVRAVLERRRVNISKSEREEAGVPGENPRRSARVNGATYEKERATYEKEKFFARVGLEPDLSNL